MAIGWLMYQRDSTGILVTCLGYVGIIWDSFLHRFEPTFPETNPKMMLHRCQASHHRPRRVVGGALANTQMHRTVTWRQRQVAGVTTLANQKPMVLGSLLRAVAGLMLRLIGL